MAVMQIATTVAVMPMASTPTNAPMKALTVTVPLATLTDVGEWVMILGVGEWVVATVASPPSRLCVAGFAVVEQHSCSVFGGISKLRQ